MGTPDAGDEKVKWWTVVGQNGPGQACRALGEGERAVRMHKKQDMIRKERPDRQGAEDAWGGGGSSRRGRYASTVKVVFADAHAILSLMVPHAIPHSCSPVVDLP